MLTTWLFRANLATATKIKIGPSEGFMASEACIDCIDLVALIILSGLNDLVYCLLMITSWWQHTARAFENTFLADKTVSACKCNPINMKGVQIGVGGHTVEFETILCRCQCDQMAGIYFIICPLAIMNICPNKKVDSKFCQILTIVFDKVVKSAKSGHTGWCIQYLSSTHNYKAG